MTETSPPISTADREAKDQAMRSAEIRVKSIDYLVLVAEAEQGAPLRARVIGLEAALAAAREENANYQGFLAVYQEAETAADARATALLEALTILRKASYEYRRLHDLKGDAAIETGRAWDILRRREDEASDLAAQQQDRQTEG